MSRMFTHHRTLALVLLAFLTAWLAPTATAQDDDQEILPEWEDAGVIDVGEYESPNFGYTLEWDDSWLINPDLGEDAVTTTSGQAPFDIISLRLQSSQIIAGVSGYSFENFDYQEPETAGAEYIEYWESGDVLDVIDDLESIEVITSDSDDEYGYLFLLAGFEDGSQTIWYRELRMLDDGETIVLTTWNSPLDEFEQGWDVTTESLEFNGDATFEFVSTNDLEDVLDTIDATLDDCAPSGDDSDACADPMETPDDDDEDSETAEYLDAIADHYVELDTSYDRFFEILGQDEISDADFTEVTEILDLWVNAEDQAEQLDPVAGYEDLHEAYLDYASLMTDAGTAFEEFLQTEQGSAEYDEASNAFFQATADAEEAGADLADLLEEEDIDLDTSGTNDDEPEDDEDNDNDNDIDSDFI